MRSLANCLRLLRSTNYHHKYPEHAVTLVNNIAINAFPIQRALIQTNRASIKGYLYRKMSDEKPVENGGVVKTEKQLQAEEKKRLKLEKLAAKKQKEGEQKKQSEDKIKPKKEKTVKPVATYDIQTPAGDKKDIVCPLPDAYYPTYVESTWYPWWEKKGFFKPEYGRESPYEENPEGQFVICIPPPNVTGTLHLGHALANAIEDSVTRWHRMNGKTALWVPGCDHAGIATQVVVERKLRKDENLGRHDLGRDKFCEKIWEWKNAKGDRIYNQLRRMGVSVDWERACFTMDEKLNVAVKEAFVRLHDEGLIYRANRLVHWSCTLNSAISDIEVDKKEITGRTLMDVPGYTQKIEFGVLHHFYYKIEDSEDTLTVATTRIETMLGDTGIAVHPTDERYKHLVGKYAVHPFCDRKMLIVADEAVDAAFGSGAVKITPAHDQNDYEIGKRHSLPFITMITEHGDICDVTDYRDQYTKFIGMKRFVARYEVLGALKEVGAYLKTENNAMVIPMCSRSKDVIEPLLKPQWYVNCKDMAADSVQAVRTGELKLIPAIHEKTWYRWLEDSRDWCISRQLWWGHRIPAYHVTVNDGRKVDVNDASYWVSGRTLEEATQRACTKFAVSSDLISLEQDEDVLDTWFSSGIFPFSIFGWPNETAELSTFYPTALLETGYDILFFWVARMTMMGKKLTGHLPFKEVYLHAMVRDAFGRKMSKSLGNIIDPVDVIEGISLQALSDKLEEYNLDPRELDKARKGQNEMFPKGIPECGTDALRFALCAYTAQGRDINLDVLRIQGYRHFCNKLWNATKFAMRNFTPTFKPESDEMKLSQRITRMDRWILSRLAAAAEASNQGFSTYDFPKSTTAIYNFWLYELCDVYLESLKPIFQGDDDEQKDCAQNVLLTCLDNGLRLLAPYMPFITEELWQRLPRRSSNPPESICVSKYPKGFSSWCNPELEQSTERMMDVVKVIRSMKEEYLSSKAKPTVYLRSLDGSTTGDDYKDVIITLAQVGGISALTPEGTAPTGCAVALAGTSYEVFMLLKGLVDFEKEITKLNGSIGKSQKQLEGLQNAAAKDDYETKVPENVRQQNTDKVDKLTLEMEKMQVAIQNFQKCLTET